MRLTARQFTVLVDEALEEIPPDFSKHLEGLAIDIQSEPDENIVAELGLRNRRELLGVYTGRPIGHRSTADGASWPDQIIIFQRNIERICHTRAEIRAQVRKTVLHEIGHHLGLSEEDLDRLGYG